MKRQFAVCLSDDGYLASLKVKKIYEVVSDEEMLGHGYIRVIDESGEDYLYATDRFYVIKDIVDLNECLESLAMA